MLKKISNKIIALLSIALLLSFSFPYPVLADASITVDLNTTYQTIWGVGFNFADSGRIDGDISQPINNTYQTMIDEWNSNWVTVGIPLPVWEPVNDNNDPDSFNWSGFIEDDLTKIIERFEALDDQGIKILAAVHFVPDWMKDGDYLATDKEDEFVESVVAFLKLLDDSYGITIDCFRFNENCLNTHYLMTSAQWRRVAEELGDRMISEGITNDPRIAWCDTTGIGGGAGYNFTEDVIDNANANLLGYLAGCSFHSYAADSDDDFSKWYDLANPEGKATWNTEADWDGQDWTKERDDGYISGWLGFEKEAEIMWRSLTKANCSVLQTWYSIPIWYHKFALVAAIFKDLPVGSQRVYSNSNDSDIRVMAFKDGSDFVIHLQNISNSDKVVDLSGLPSSLLYWYRSKSDERYKKIGSYTPSNGLLENITLPANSFNTFTTTNHGDAEYPENLLTNWSLGTGTTSSWSSNASISVIEEDVYSTLLNRLKIYNRTAYWHEAQQDVKQILIDNGQGEYLLETIAKSGSVAADGPYGQISLNITNTTGTLFSYALTGNLRSGDFTNYNKLSGVIDVQWTGTIDTAYLKIHTTKESDTQDLYIDECAFVKVSDSPVALTSELLSNTGFETGAPPDNWTSNASIERTSSESYAGTYSSRVYNRTAYWHEAQQDVEQDLIDNGQGRYLMEAWIKPASGQPYGQLSLVVVNTDGERFLYGTIGNLTSGTWTKVSAIVTIGWKGDIDTAYFKVNTSRETDTQDIYIDNVSFIKYE